MLSLRKYHVKNGKHIYDAAKAKNLALHNSCVECMINLVPYQKHNPVGIE